VRTATAITLLAAAAIAAGCGDDESAGSRQPEPSAPLVVYERAGGIAFTAQRLVVAHDGSASVSVEGPGEIGADFEVSAGELDELRAALEDATLEGEQGEPTCADCYLYEIEYGGEIASFDQTMVPADAEALIALLGDIVEREVPSGPARGGA
jgi:hypothetical protein